MPCRSEKVKAGAAVYVILTSKPGQFRTELGAGLRPVETHDFVFFGRVKARFVIAELEQEVKVKVVDETPPEVVNLVPSKFLEKFPTLEQARAELAHVVRADDPDASLVRR
jgi:hypothetical protein